jgi:acetolactate synthase-1/2/3 large subunit
MNGAECLLRTLVAGGVNVCFTNPGTSEMQFVAALDRVPAMRAVLCLFEGVCSGAADGYARMTGDPACTLLHLGPGLANALANFHNARKARSPVVSVVGEHSTQHLRYDAPLSADIEQFARAVSDQIRVVPNSEEIGRSAAEAIAAARLPPGAISQLIVPADHSWNPAGEVGSVPARVSAPAPDSSVVCAAARLVRNSGSVGVLLGGRTLQARGLDAAARLRAAGIPVFADRNAPRTDSGRGRFQPRRIAYFPEPAYAMLERLEHLITVEAKPPVSFFGYPGLRSPLLPEHCQVHTLSRIDEDGASALEQLAELVCAPACEPPLADAAEQAPDGDQPLTPDTIGRVLAAALPQDSIIADEMISASEPVWRHLLRAAPHSFLPITGGSIGQGLPLATGAAIACPDRKVVALEADGSAMYTLQALWTAARENLDITVVVFANRRYRILDVEMKRTGVDQFGPAAGRMIDIADPELNFVRLSEGLGVEAVRVTRARELAAHFARAMHSRGPLVIEAMMDQAI